MAWDWRHLIDTSRPDYYRWTQWIFLQLFRAGLAYQAEAPVLWCPSCLTVLAREQTERDGSTCERCGTIVAERVMRQWFLRITAYADRLLDGLEHLDWPERAKRLQRRWIGRSQGWEIDFGLVGGGERLTVFTTRPDTLLGVSFLAVPAGHPAAGGRVCHPLTGDPVPVVAADYVVEDYGTGVVMGVPAHDERDGRFAAANGLPLLDAPLLDDVPAVARPVVRYRMRDWLISRQRYWGPPIPVVHCDRDGAVAVPDHELPVLLPDVDDVRPSGTELSPLASVSEFVDTTCPTCGGPARRETDVSDTFFDSSWYFLRYPSSDVSDAPWDDVRTARWLPVDFYAGGVEHVQRHHLYARFVTMALHDLGVIGFEEPFPRVRLGGLIVHEGAKMSKSRGNVVGPDRYVEQHGADVLRCALLFSAPWEAGGEFRDDSIAGIERFFTRVWRAVVEPRPSGSADEIGEIDEMVDQTIVDVTGAIEGFRFNVALARLMELTARAHSAARSADTRAPARTVRSASRRRAVGADGWRVLGARAVLARSRPHRAAARRGGDRRTGRRPGTRPPPRRGRCRAARRRRRGRLASRRGALARRPRGGPHCARAGEAGKPRHAHRDVGSRACRQATNDNEPRSWRSSRPS